MSKKRIVGLLKQIGVIQTGEFTLKSGKKSDLYFDLRKLYSDPTIFKIICSLMWNLVDTDYDLICGVPTGAIPMATIMSAERECPMIILRKEEKQYGGKNLVEGTFEKGDRVLLIEDVMTTGSSIQESIEKLESLELKVVQTIVVINRGSNLIKSLLTEQDIRDIIFLPEKMKTRTFTNPMATKLWDIVLKKNTNICLSADVGTLGNLLKIAETCGDHICMLKIHWDCIYIEPLYSNSLKTLYKLAKEKNFLILDDRKYADIDSIVSHQFTTSNCCDGVTAHSIFGQGTINGIKNSDKFTKFGKGIFLIAQSSSNNNLIDELYSSKTVTLARKNKKSVAGFISQHGLAESTFLYLTPGISLDKIKSGQQNYKTPQNAIEGNSDILIVGRGIYNSENVIKECKRYKDAGWKALVSRYDSQQKK